MAHNARKEDYQRLALHFIQSLDANEPLAAMKAFATFGQTFAQDRDSLPQTDADRAFNLVASATEIVDYQLPFSTGAAAAELVARGKKLLGEAVALDPDCFDALRMRSSNELPNTSARFSYLAEEEPRVREACERARAAAADESMPERAGIAQDLAMRPYLRWVSSMAESALICGRNRQCAELARKLLELDPTDISDARFTLALALAKLEDEAGLEELRKTYHSYNPTRGADDAWMLIARLALAHKRRDFDAARALLAELLRAYPTGAVALLRQNELPDGEFARIQTDIYSEDELVVALSESVVLLQEGNDSSGRGVLGTWLVNETAKIRPEAVAEAKALEAQVQAIYGAQQGGEAR